MIQQALDHVHVWPFFAFISYTHFLSDFRFKLRLHQINGIDLKSNNFSIPRRSSVEWLAPKHGFTLTAIGQMSKMGKLITIVFPKTQNTVFSSLLIFLLNWVATTFFWYQIPINHLAGSIIVIWITLDKSIVRSFQISKRSTGLMFKYYTGSEIIKLEVAKK